MCASIYSDHSIHVLANPEHGNSLFILMHCWRSFSVPFHLPSEASWSSSKKKMGLAFKWLAFSYRLRALNQVSQTCPQSWSTGCCFVNTSLTQYLHTGASFLLLVKLHPPTKLIQVFKTHRDFNKDEIAQSAFMLQDLSSALLPPWLLLSEDWEGMSDNHSKSNNICGYDLHLQLRSNSLQTIASILFLLDDLNNNDNFCPLRILKNFFPSSARNLDAISFFL